MKIIVDNSATVKEKIDKGITYLLEQEKVQKKLAEKFGKQEYRKNLHTRSAEKFTQIAEDIKLALYYIEELEKSLEDLSKNCIKKKPKTGIQLSLRFEEVTDLPEEVLKELSLSDSDKTDYQIRSLMEQLGGIASLDRLIVGIYRETGEVIKRSTITSKLYRMVQRGIVYGVPGKKGVYSLEELSPEDVEKIIKGVTDDE